MSTSTATHPGLSGMSLYVPRLRVQLEDWCRWTGAPWEKIQHVVGRSFRMPAPYEDVYTMTAQAALKLILDCDVDPESIGYLALGTESSKDNAAGAVIVRGMLDRALEARGLPRLSRNCEVPEIKHACLGGIYGLKGALRYVSCDGAGRRAIVLSGDVAEYARGSSGEQTQGAGAVAMLVDRHPTLAEIDLARSGSASAYRGPDFRKPFARHFVPGYAADTKRLHDFPVFSGKYSTFSYVDETVESMRELLRNNRSSAKDYFRKVKAMFFHRPYAHMPQHAIAFLFVRALAGGFHPEDEDRERLAQLCEQADIDLEGLLAEAKERPDLYGDLLDHKEARDPFPLSSRMASHLRKSPYFAELLDGRLSLGAETAMDFGNLYTAALPAWLAAGFEEAHAKRLPLTGQELLCIGYGSGDAAEAFPLVPTESWYDAAAAIRVRSALAEAIDLDQAAYEELHDHGRCDVAAPESSFFISRTGDVNDAAFQDVGVDYYEYAG